MRKDLDNQLSMDTILEREDVKHRVDDADDERDGQKYRICFYEHALQLLRLSLGARAPCHVQIHRHVHLHVRPACGSVGQ